MNRISRFFSLFSVWTATPWAGAVNEASANWNASPTGEKITLGVTEASIVVVNVSLSVSVGAVIAGLLDFELESTAVMLAKAHHIAPLEAIATLRKKALYQCVHCGSKANVAHHRRSRAPGVSSLSKGAGRGGQEIRGDGSSAAFSAWPP
jgi:hypothetical protein